MEPVSVSYTGNVLYKCDRLVQKQGDDAPYPEVSDT